MLVEIVVFKNQIFLWVYVADQIERSTLRLRSNWSFETTSRFGHCRSSSSLQSPGIELQSTSVRSTGTPSWAFFPPHRLALVNSVTLLDTEVITGGSDCTIGIHCLLSLKSVARMSLDVERILSLKGFSSVNLLCRSVDERGFMFFQTF
jgi:hypothetical protein